jgi:hypothetical protein
VALVASNVDATHPLPKNGSIVLQFNRYLNPDSVSRQSFVIADAGNQAIQGTIVSYDPIALTVTLSNPNTPLAGATTESPWLTEGQTYKVFIPVAASATDTSGVRALDNAPLDPAAGTIELAFQVVKDGAPPSLPKMSFCGDILPIFYAKCGTGSPCHSAPDGTKLPAASLVLTSPEGLSQTAIGRISQASNTSGISGQSVPPGRVFGLNFPIIDPGHSATSWLVYKIAMAPPPDNSTLADKKLYVCPDSAGKSVAPQTTNIKSSAFPVSEDESAALSDQILGRSMPYPSYGLPTYETNALDFEERERIRLWIDQGAPVEACGLCSK